MKNRYKKLLFIIISIFVALMLLNTIVSKIITNKVNNFVLENSFKLHTAKVEEVKFNIFNRSVTAKNLFLSPDNESLDELKKEELNGKTLKKISIASIAFNGISLVKIILFNDIKFDELVIDDILVQKFINSEDKEEIKTSKAIDLDSLEIEKIKGLEIGKLTIRNFHYQEIDILSKRIWMELKPVDLNITGLILDHVAGTRFKLLPFKENIKIHNIDVSIPKTGYNIGVEAVYIDFSESIIDLKNLKYKPINNRDSLALSYHYNTEVYDIDLKREIIYNFQWKKLLKKQGLFIDSIQVHGLNLQIYKDKRKPFNKNKRPKIPHIFLKKMEFPLYLQKVNIDSSRIVYEERVNDKNEYKIMKITLDQTYAKITNITSIEKFREKPLKMNITSKFMDKADLDVSIELPLKDYHDTFYFNGVLGPSQFSDFDKVIYPALGMKISKGNLDRLKFSASANSESSEGKMIMLYHGMEAKVIKQKSSKKNKFVSWIVRGVTYESNPRKGKHLKEIYMHTDRVVYKGFINYIWKTLQSGIIGTITPIGRTTEEERKKKKDGRKDMGN